jgi:hypothetical protein
MSNTQPTWKTKDGRVIPVKEMTTMHIQNTIAFLEKKHDERILNAVMCMPDFQGEMAQMTADAEFNRILNSEPEDLWPIYTDLIEELRRRGVQPFPRESAYD